MRWGYRLLHIFFPGRAAGRGPRAFAGYAWRR